MEMQMQPYMQRAAQVVCDSSIAVQVLLNPDNTDLEIWPLKPEANESELTSRQEFAGRALRSVGVIGFGLQGLKPFTAFKEALEPDVVNAISRTFLEYLRVLIGESFSDAAEIAELERIYAYRDPSAPVQ